MSGDDRSEAGGVAVAEPVAAERAGGPTAVDGGPAISLPKGGGAIRATGEKFAANPVTGSASFTVAVPTSPGRSGFGPRLELAYDSAAGNGPFGFGWTLSTPAIARRTDRGLPRYLDDDTAEAEADTFVLSGAEDLVPVYRRDPDGRWVADHPGHTREPGTDLVRGPGGDLVVHEDDVEGHRVRRYRPRVEGRFSRIERWTRLTAPDDVHWRSLGGDDVLTVYGADGRSRIADPQAPGRIFSWLICETRDAKGNAVRYGYAAEDGTGADLTATHQHHRGRADDPRRTANRYLKRITYGNRTPLLVGGRRPAFVAPGVDPRWMFELVLDYGEHDADAPTPGDTGPWDHRPDAFSTYRAGFEVRTARRCRRILMFHHFPDDPAVGRDCLVRSLTLSHSAADDPVHSFLTTVTEAGHRRATAGEGTGYVTRPLPPIELTYSRPVVHDRVEEVDPASLENLPTGLDGATYRWVDLHGEGVPGVLTEQAGAWYYKRNLSPLPVAAPGGGEQVRARFAPVATVALRPNADLGRGAQIADLAGDGRPDVVVTAADATNPAGAPGFYEHDGDGGWASFRPFTSRLTRRLDDPDLRLVDLDGDGRADVLVTEGDAVVWHPSLGEAGFGPAVRVPLPPDEAAGPRVVFGDGTQSIHLADLSGDGSADLVRVRNGEVSYWPNLGHGRFGARVSMDGAPRFDHPDRFDPARLRLADIDGSGTTDLVYLHPEGVRLYVNRSGNGWSPPVALASFPRIDDPAGISVVDLLGNGTACVVWSSSLPGDAARPLRYVALMGPTKPHLLVGAANNLGAETRIRYAPSTTFALRDRQAGRPWTTRLPFPVHVVERVTTYDHVGRSRHVARYAYHDGHFDGDEREFRGFGMVERWDTEELAVLTTTGDLPPGDNEDPASHVPPVLTRSWFHTGAHPDPRRRAEWFREPGTTGGDALLPDPALPPGLTGAEAREALRALKGTLLRQEVYAVDAGPGAEPDQARRARTPYTVARHAHAVRLLQPRGAHRHAVFLAHPRAAITHHHERDATDPRTRHELTLEVDDHGLVLKRADVGYGRRATVRVVDAAGQVQEVPNPGLAALAAADRATQTTTLVTYTETRVTNGVDTADAYRLPQLCETVVHELTGYPPTGPGGTFRAEDLVEPDPAAPGRLRHRFTTELAYEAAASGPRCRRPVERQRTLFRHDDLTGLAPLGELPPLALPGEQYRLAFTPGLLAQVFRRPRIDPPGAADEDLLPDPAAVLGGEGGYLPTSALVADGRFPATGTPEGWWAPSGRSFFTADPGDAAADELTEARAHFFLPRRRRDPFGHDATVTYDPDDLLLAETRDAVGNRTTVLAHDHRALQPRLVADPNGNRTEVAFDALGMVVGTALMGKAPPAPTEGDTLAGFVADLAAADVDGLMAAADPGTRTAALLQGATTRVVYDLDRFHRTRRADPDDPARWQPAAAVTLTRETHVADPLPPHGLRIRLGFQYSDGFGRVVQTKGPAEPGPVAAPGPVVDPRWVTSGWTVTDNKGNPIRRYEPYFSATHRFERGVRAGVSPVLFYDPAQRVVATLLPDGTYAKTTFDAWQHTSHDPNDTCAPRNAQTGDPRTDPDVRGYVAGFFAQLAAAPPAAGPAPGWQTWHARRIGGDLGPEEQAAAGRAAAHADTPTTVHLDPWGRTIATVTRNRVACPGHDLDGTEEVLVGRVELDIEGNERALLDGVAQAGDPRGRVVGRYRYDLVGRRIHQVSMDAGARWMLDDAAGHPIRAWDSRGHTTTTRYDALRRPVSKAVRGSVATGPAASDPRTLAGDVVVERIEYGEPPAGATPAEVARAERLNLRTRGYRHHDEAGVAVNARLDAAGEPVEAYDFAGRLLHSTRRLLADPTVLPDWAPGAATPPLLDAERFEASTRYDALGRAVQSVTPWSDAAGGTRNVVQAGYDRRGGLQRVDVWLERAAAPAGLLDPAVEPPSAVGVADVDYDAKGQRLRVDLRNGTTTTFGYDPLTLRLTRLVTRRPAPAFPGDDPQPPVTGWPGRNVQDLTYTYDPVGNVVRIRDDAQQAVFFRNQRVEPSNDYTYDALYRLVQATGREHLGQQADGNRRPPTAPGGGHVAATRLDHPGDGAALGTYLERYVYDAVGAILAMQHRGSDPAHPGWSRAYEYAEPSAVEGRGAETGNRLSRTTVGGGGAGGTVEAYRHDAHGNMVRMPHVGGPGENLHWDHDDRLRRADLGGGGTAHYAYGASGERVRQVWEKSPGLVEERIHLGGVELFRRRTPTTVTLERATLHVMDDRVRVALVETRTRGTDPAPRQLVRYQLGNHLGSATLELDEQSRIVSHEEHAPYGATTYHAVRSHTETPKRYRFTGREHDEATGLYVHGVRHYACWLGVWTAADPAGLVDGSNLYRYVANNPVRLVDTGGTDAGGAALLLLAPEAAGPVTLTVSSASTVTTATRTAGLGGVGEAMGPLGFYAAAVIALCIVSTKRYMDRTTSLVRYGNPHGMPTQDLYVPQLEDVRAANEARVRWQQVRNPYPKPDVDIDPDPDPFPEPAPQPKPQPDPRKPEPKPQWGRVYVTYTKLNVKTGLFYSGRTSMEVDLNKPMGPQAVAAVAAREANHHIDEKDEPTDPAFLPAQIDRYAVGFAVDYDNRYRDPAYLAIRGREQQLIDHFGLKEAAEDGPEAVAGFAGGARSDTHPGRPLTENNVRAVGKENEFGLLFHQTAEMYFGVGPPYTGYKPGDRVQAQ